MLSQILNYIIGLFSKPKSVAKTNDATADIDKDEDHGQGIEVLQEDPVVDGDGHSDTGNEKDKAMELSKKGLDFIKSYEKLKLEAYTATADEARRNIWTIGYGSTYWPNGQPVRKGEKLRDEVEAEHLFSVTVTDFEKAVRDSVKVPLTQGQYDALVSLAFNIGIGAFKASTLVRVLNSGDYNAASQQILRWNKQNGKVLKGLVRRREDERKMFVGN